MSGRASSHRRGLRAAVFVAAVVVSGYAFGGIGPSSAQDGPSAAPEQSSSTLEFDEDELFEEPDSEEEKTPADGAGERRLRRVDEPPLDRMGREEAESAGFVFGAESDDASRTSATLLAATAGIFAHGIGHWYVEDRRTAGILLGMQGVSLALIGSAFAWQGLSEGSPASRIYAGPALYAGLGLFGLSYLLDVVGTMQQTDIGLPPNSRRERGIAVEAHYSYLDLDGYGANSLQMLTAGTTFDFDWLYVGLRTDQDVRLDTSIYGASIGGRPWRGPGRHTFVFTEAEAEIFQFGGAGAFRRTGVRARVGVSLGGGQWISQLRNVAAGAAVGLGHRWYELPAAGQPQLEPALGTSSIPFDIFLHFNMTEHLNVRAAYGRRDGAFLQSTPPGVGVGALEFLFRSSDNLDLVLGAELGGGFGLSGGLRLWFWQ